MNVVTRFAPSPTGTLHIGSARTALFNYIFAKQNNGKFILRIEDTDKERSKKEFETDILESLKWLGLNHDEFYRQSERTAVYEKYLNELVKKDLAYVAEDNVIRFRNPNKKVKFNDLILGEIEFDTTELKDFVIAKNFQTPLYHLAVVVDDYEMGITHVIRGQDHISNTPRQILIIEALGFGVPVYAHIPLILAPDKSKLSKRHGALSVLEYKNTGYFPEAIINFLALLGWHPKDDRELFSLTDLIKEFELKRVGKSGAVFDVAKLDWLNKEYLKILPHQEVFKYIKNELSELDDNLIEKILPLILERISKLSDLIIVKEEFKFIWSPEDYSAEDLIWKDSNREKTKEHLEKSKELIEKLAVGNEITAKEVIWPYALKAGKGTVLWPLRFALSSREKSPDPFTLISILGKEEALARIDIAIQKL